MVVLTEKQVTGVLQAARAKEAWLTWRSRPDDPANFEQQTAYVNSRDIVSFCLGGTGSGKTESSARKCADFLMTQPPPRPDTPFWIIGETYKQVCATCWGEKLAGMRFLPASWIDPKRSISYYNSSMRWPLMVPLRKWSNGNNWIIEFMSYEQGREKMQARSIGGFWFSEQFPWHIFQEVLARCRQYLFRGGQFCEFTPLNPDLCIAMEKVLDDPPAGWGFYRLNTAANRPNLSAEWFDSFYANVPDEMLATRLTGALATFEGVIFQTFMPAVHVTDDDRMAHFPNTRHYRGIDWGASVEHPMAVVWACEDGIGDWLIYDEYLSTSQDAITQDHAAEVVARSIAWGWPAPDFYNHPTPRLANYVSAVRARVSELTNDGIPQNHGGRDGQKLRFYGDSYADPSRPGEINAFNQFGIQTFPANNQIYQGIDTVRSKLKINSATGLPRLRIHSRCKHLIEQMRKYRWPRRRENVRYELPATRPVPLKREDDEVDALRYCLHTVQSRRGLQPSSTASKRIDEHRQDVHLDRPGNGRQRLSLATAGEKGWFKR